jgi:hypothetical protein
VRSINTTRLKAWGDHDGSDSTSKTDTEYKTVWPDVVESDWCGNFEAIQPKGGMFDRLLDMLPSILEIWKAEQAASAAESGHPQAPEGAVDEARSAAASEGEPAAPEDSLFAILAALGAGAPHAGDGVDSQNPTAPAVLDALSHLGAMFFKPKKATQAEPVKETPADKQV